MQVCHSKGALLVTKRSSKSQHFQELLQPATKKLLAKVSQIPVSILLIRVLTVIFEMEDKMKTFLYDHYLEWCVSVIHAVS